MSDMGIILKVNLLLQGKKPSEESTDDSEVGLWVCFLNTL